MPRYGFGTFVVDTDSIEVVGPDGLRELEPQVFRVLEYLLEQRGRLVTKEELLDNVWGDRFVSESALTTRIKQARRALDDDGRRQWAIKTVFGRGYRFVPDVILQTDGGGSGVTAAAAHFPEELEADSRRLFHGREADLAQALAALDGPSSDAFRWIWILGEPGIGKSRLAAEVARIAHDRDHRVLFGRNNEDLRVPYQPFIEAIRSTLDHVAPEQWEAEFGSGVEALSPLLPELAQVATPGDRIDTLTTDESRRYELFEGIARWLTDRAAESAVMMIIDDAHWAAESTLQLLAHLQHRRSAHDIALVVTARDTAPDTNPRVSDLIAASQGAEHTTTIRLTGLSEEASLRLVGGSVEVAEVMRQTAGNPLLLQAVDPTDGSVDVGSAVRRRLAGLSRSVQETLGLCSLIGLEFELTVAAAAAGRDELDVLDDLERAVAARLLDDVGVDRFRFTHALIRSSLRDDLGSARSARLHGRIATAIDAVFPDDARRLRPLAFHTAQAASADPPLRPAAVERLRRASQESMEQLSFDEAAAQLELARDLVGPADAHLLAELALEQGIAETRAGFSVPAVETFEAAISAARSSGDAALLIEAAIRYEDAAWRPGSSGLRTVAHLDEALAVLDDETTDGLGNELELRARLMIARLRALAISGQTGESDEVFESAYELTRELGNPNLEAAALNVYLTQVRLFEATNNLASLIDRLAELEPVLDDPDVAMHSIHSRLLYGTLTGTFDQQGNLAATMTRLQEESHSRFWAFIRMNQLAMDALYVGDLEASEELSEQTLALADELPEEDGLGTYGLRMFLIRREQDRLAAMAPVVRRVVDSEDSGDLWTPGLALLLIETGAADEAAQAVASLKERSFDLPVDAMWSTIMVLLAEVFVHLGDAEACALLRDRMQGLSGSNVVTGSGLVCFGSADRYLGMLSLTMGELERAEEFLGVALETDAAGGSPLRTNETRYWLSRVRRAQGHDLEADAMLEVVEREAEPAGFLRLHRIASAELGR